MATYSMSLDNGSYPGTTPIVSLGSGQITTLTNAWGPSLTTGFATSADGTNFALFRTDFSKADSLSFTSGVCREGRCVGSTTFTTTTLDGASVAVGTQVLIQARLTGRWVVATCTAVN